MLLTLALAVLIQMGRLLGCDAHGFFTINPRVDNCSNWSSFIFHVIQHCYDEEYQDFAYFNFGIRGDQDHGGDRQNRTRSLAKVRDKQASRI
jgi:hypothetical protein